MQQILYEERSPFRNLKGEMVGSRNAHFTFYPVAVVWLCFVLNGMWFLKGSFCLNANQILGY